MKLKKIDFTLDEKKLTHPILALIFVITGGSIGVLAGLHKINYFWVAILGGSFSGIWFSFLWVLNSIREDKDREWYFFGKYVGEPPPPPQITDGKMGESTLLTLTSSMLSGIMAFYITLGSFTLEGIPFFLLQLIVVFFAALIMIIVIGATELLFTFMFIMPIQSIRDSIRK